MHVKDIWFAHKNCKHKTLHVTLTFTVCLVHVCFKSLDIRISVIINEWTSFHHAFSSIVQSGR